jgi:hypothetical protein
MKLTIQFFDGCPHWQLAEQRLRQAMTDLGRKDVEITYQRIDSPDDAEQFSFHGSPTILVNGRDAFAGGEMPVSFGCRVYATEVGTQGAPSVAQLRHVLRSAP